MRYPAAALDTDAIAAAAATGGCSAVMAHQSLSRRSANHYQQLWRLLVSLLCRYNRCCGQCAALPDSDVNSRQARVQDDLGIDFAGLLLRF